MPAQDHLGRSFAGPPRHGKHRRGVETAPLAERRPALGDDTQPVMQGAKSGLLEAGVQLDLVQDRDHSGFTDQPFQMRAHEVRHADRSHPPLLPQADQRAPGVDIAFLRRGWPVDQAKVNPVQLQPLKARLDRAQGGVMALLCIPDLGGDENLVAWNTAVADPVAQAFLVAVDRRAVDQPVAHLQRGSDGGCGLVRRDLPDAKAKGGNEMAVVQAQTVGGHG
jgi:hypothetical protein